MSEWDVEIEKKEKRMISISSSSVALLESMKKFMSSKSEIKKISDSQAIESAIKIASKNREFKNWLKANS